MAIDRVPIREALSRVGLQTFPKQDHEQLAGYGLDSLAKALLVLELERAYLIRFSNMQLSGAEFASIESIAQLIESMKAKP